MFAETMDNIEGTEQVDWILDNDDLKKKQKQNWSNAEKLGEWDRFFRYDEPDKPVVDDPNDTFSDKKNIIRDFVNGEWMNTLPWFEREIWNKNISVESKKDSFHILVRWDQWWWIDIVFDNIPQNKEQKDKNVQFINMKITWNVLDYESMKHFSPQWAKEFPNGLKSSDNPDDVKNVILWVEKLIMKPEIHSVHGNRDKQIKANIMEKENEERNKESLDILLAQLNFDPEMSNKELALYLMDSINFDEWFETYRKVLLSMIILHRHVSFETMVEKMKDKNQEDLQENTQRNADEKNIDDWELIIEFLSNNTSLRSDIVNSGEYLINQAKNDAYASGDEKNFLQS